MSCQGGRVGLNLVCHGLPVGLLFAVLAAALGAQDLGGGVLRGAAEPGRENCFRAERARFPRQNDESGLGYFLRQMRVPKLVQRD